MDPKLATDTDGQHRQPTPEHSSAPTRRRVPLGVLVASALLLVAAILPAFLMMSMSVSANPGGPGGGASVGISSTATATATKPPTTASTPSVGLPMLGGLQQTQDAAQEAYANALIAKMSTDEEIGQMIMISFPETAMDSTLQYEIQHYHVGSAILYAFNIQNGPQVKSLVEGMQGSSPTIPLIVSTDQEGGSVNRLVSVDGYPTNPAGAADMGATMSPKQIEARGKLDAQYLASLGINLNLAPVVDVRSAETYGGFVGRTFGNTPQQVTTDAGAYLAGLQQSGQVMGTLKHFPGLGAVPTDPHASLYHLTRSLNDLETIDWAPYKALLATGQVHAIMSTHVVVDAVDPTLPASLSEPVLTGILRNQLGFNGVILTDGLYMQALWGIFPGDYAPIFLHAVQAGNDIMCSLWNMDEVQLFQQTMHTALANGSLSKAQIDASVRRILILKMQLGLIQTPGN